MYIAVAIKHKNAIHEAFMITGYGHPLSIIWFDIAKMHNLSSRTIFLLFKL